MQDYRTHRRFNPLYHFVAMPIFIANLIGAVVHLVRYPSAGAAWLVAVAFGLFLALGLGRQQALRMQDRIIRLEERLRIQALAPELATEFQRLNRRQVAALRFASDAELPELARRTIAGEFAHARDIKRAVSQWRPDHMRV